MDYTPITITLDAKEAELIQELGRLRGLDEPAEVLRALLIEAYDALWDKTFEESQDLLEKLSDEAHAEYLAGLTEEFDADNEAEEAADEAEWDAQFARSRDFLRKKVREALERDRAELSE